MLRLCLLVILVAMSSLCPRQALADDAAQARFFDRVAREHYEAGRFKEALRAFFEEHRLAPNPRIVFNIALCFERLDQKAQAYAYYVEFLAAEDTDPTRKSYAEKARSRLSKGVSRVRVVTTPPGAEIFVDDREHGSYGKSPREVVVPPGKHEISATHPGYKTASRSIAVVEGRLVETSLVLELVQGTLQLQTTPPSTARIRDPDGKTVAEGPTPFTGVLPVGVYVVELSAPNHETAEIVARIEADRTTTQSAALKAQAKRTGEVVFTANVAGALVEVDGAPVGFAPIVSKLPEGPHALRITHPDRSDYSTELAVRPQQRAWLTAELQPPARTERSSLTWVSGGLGAALLTTGAIVGVLANDKHNEFVAAQNAGRDDIFELRSDGQALNITADTLMITGAVGLVTGIILYFVTEREISTPSSASVAWESQ